MRILVTGATGFVGHRLVPSLLDAGYDVVTLVRDPEYYDAPSDVSVITGDLLDPDSIQGIFDQIDVAFYLVHSLRAGPNFAKRDRQAAANFVAAANESAISRVIYLGGLGETGDELSEHLRSRREIEAILASGDFDLTTLRAAIIIGNGSASFAMLEQLASRLPIMITPRWVRTECQPIAIDDVIAYLVGVLCVPETARKTFEIGGPEILSYEEMIQLTARELRTNPLIVPVPFLSPQLSVYWVDLVTDIPASIAHPLIYGLKNPVVVTDSRIQEYVEIELTPFATAVKQAVSHA